MNRADDRRRAVTLRDRLQAVSQSVREDPDLMRIAQHASGHQIAVWQTADGPHEFNITEAQEELRGLLRKHGLDLLRTRSGKEFRPELLTFSGR